MNNRRVLIANLSKATLGESPAHRIGAFLASAFAQAAEARAIIPEANRVDFTLYADEFQNFATGSFGLILSEARKWRLSLVLAHQFLGQLPPRLRAAVVGNVGSLVAFRTSLCENTDECYDSLVNRGHRWLRSSKGLIEARARYFRRGSTNT